MKAIFNLHLAVGREPSGRVLQMSIAVHASPRYRFFCAAFLTAPRLPSMESAAGRSGAFDFGGKICQFMVCEWT